MAAGRGHVYLHGGQKLWDYAAGTLILSEIGGYSISLDGKPIFKLTMAPRSVVTASNKPLFTDWHRWLLEAAEHSG